ncbi:hypothetical protein D9M72_488050 [compost metagenome]
MQAMQAGEQVEEAVGRVPRHFETPGGELLPDPQLASQEGHGEHTAEQECQGCVARTFAGHRHLGPLQAGAAEAQQGGVHPEHPGMGQGRQRVGQRAPVRHLGTGDEGQQEQQEQRGHHAEENPQADPRGAVAVLDRRFRLPGLARGPAARPVAVGMLPELRAHGRFSVVVALPLASRRRCSSSSETVCGTKSCSTPGTL